jgi:hypothetical protein
VEEDILEVGGSNRRTSIYLYRIRMDRRVSTEGIV